MIDIQDVTVTGTTKTFSILFEKNGEEHEAEVIYTDYENMAVPEIDINNCDVELTDEESEQLINFVKNYDRNKK